MAVLALGLAGISVSGSIALTGTTLSLVNDNATPGNNYVYGTDGAGAKAWRALSAFGVTTLTGTAGQVLVNGGTTAASGPVTLTLAAALTGINSVTSTAGQPLVLATGTSGTAISVASATNIATFTAGIVGTSATLSSLTAGRVTFAGASGLLSDDADFTFATDTLTVTKVVAGGISLISNAITAANSVTSVAASNLVLSTGSFGTAITVASATGAVTVASTVASTNTTSGSGVFGGGIGVAGAIYSAGERILNSYSQNGVTRVQARNDTSGTAAQAQVAATLGDFTSYIAMGLPSAGFSTSGLFAANTGYVASSATAGLNVFTIGATPLVLGVNGAASLTITSAGIVNTASVVGIGISGSADRSLYLGSTALTGVNQFGIVSQAVFTSSATTAGYAGVFNVITAASAFTMVDGFALHISGPGLGAGSSITTVTGLKVTNQGASGVTNAYGVDISAQSGAATVNVGLRNAGTTLLTNTTEATTISAASAVLSGGLSVAKSLVIAGQVSSSIATTATAAGTTTLTAASKTVQVFNGSTTQTVNLPAANALGAGIAVHYAFVNVSTGIVTLTRAGSDKILSSASPSTGDNTYALGGDGAGIDLYSDGVDKWYAY